MKPISGVKKSKGLENPYPIITKPIMKRIKPKATAFNTTSQFNQAISRFKF